MSACGRSTTSGSVARASGVRSQGREKGGRETKKPRNSRADQKGVFSKRLSHNGTVRVTSFLTSCQVASLTAASVLLCRRQLDVARLLTIAPANDEAGDELVSASRAQSSVAVFAARCRCPPVITTRRPHVDVWSAARNWNGANESAASGFPRPLYESNLEEIAYSLSLSLPFFLLLSRKKLCRQR